MKLFIVFLAVLMLSAALVAAETEIFSGVVVTDTDKDIGGTIFRFGYDETSDKVLVQAPPTALIVENGGCKSGSTYKVCINRANFSYKNISTYKYYYELDAVVYKRTGSLSANSTVSLGTLLQGESAEFAITITNPTDFQVSGISYAEDFTPFSVTRTTGCELEGNKILWRGSLESKHSKKCTATIVAVKEGAYNLAGDLKYFNSLDTEEKTTEPASVTVLPKQLQLIKLIDNNTQVKKPFYMNMSLQNIHDEEDIRLSIKIEIPSNIDVLKTKPEFDITARTLKKGVITLRPGVFFNYSLYLEETSEGYNPITQEFNYAIKGISDVIGNTTLLRQPIIEPIAEPKIETLPENQSTAANSQPNENATAATEISTQIPQNTNTENASAKSQQENKTAVQTVITENPKQSFINKKTLMLLALVFPALLIVFLIVRRIRKRKKAVLSPQEQLLRELEESLRKG